MSADFWLDVAELALGDLLVFAIRFALRLRAELEEQRRRAIAPLASLTPSGVSTR